MAVQFVPDKLVAPVRMTGANTIVSFEKATFYSEVIFNRYKTTYGFSDHSG